MKHLLATVFFSILFNFANSQSISPVQTAEFCPNLEYTFTVSILKQYSGIIGLNGCMITQTPQVPVGTTFTFKGKFADANQMQTFQIIHPDGTNTPFAFKKIKSLFFSATSLSIPPCNLIRPNQIQPILFPLCQLATATISFPNIQWFTNFENPEICFGTVTDYEYLLPSGWKLGTTTSTGNWIAGTNNVTVTSDLSTGDGADIRIRASNKSCAAGLSANGPVSFVRISRPRPTLTFTGGYTVCSSQNFQAFNVPSWVTNYNWLVTPNTVFGNANSTSNPTTVTKASNGEGNIQLTISSASCPASFVYNTLEITGRTKLVAGSPEVFSNTPPMMIYSGPGTENEVCRYQGTIFDLTYTANSMINWTFVSYQGAPSPVWSPEANGDIYVEFFRARQNTLVLQMNASNTCGTTSYQFGFKAIDCALRMAATANDFKISPNPASNMINIISIEPEIENVAKKLITAVVISDMSNNIMSSKKFDKVQTAELFIGGLKPGMYYITIDCGQTKEVQKIIKQ